MMTMLLWLVFLVVVLGVVWWIISQIPLPAPMGMVVRVVFGLLALIVLFWLFSSMIGPPSFHHSLGLIRLHPRL